MSEPNKVETFKYWTYICGKDDFNVHPCAKSVSPSPNGGGIGFILTYRHLLKDGVCERCGEKIDRTT